MGTEAPTPLVLPIHCAPEEAPCPNCGKHGRRKRACTRRVRTVAYKRIASLEVTCGEYQARCVCREAFRNAPEPVLPGALPDNEVRDPARERLIDDGTSAEPTLASLRREFLLGLSTGFVYDVLRDHAAALDMAEHRRMVLDRFSGTPGAGELHLGRFTLLLATDPLADLPVAVAPVNANDQGHMRRFLRDPKTRGLAPAVVVTDGSNLDPTALAELWPDAAHPLCVLHGIEDINEPIRDAVRRLRSAMSRRGQAGRKKKRGRKGAKSEAAAARRGLTLEQKSSFVARHRCLIVKRREDVTERDREDLTRMPESLPESATLRRFADRISWLFATPRDGHRARCRRAVIVRDAASQAVPELARAPKQRDEEEFPRLMAYPAHPVSRRVRTNNHVERTNRLIRSLGKVRSEWRRRRTPVRFVVLTFDRLWEGRTTPGGKATGSSRATGARPAEGKTKGRRHAA
jgi:hypothetical protein